MNLLSSRTLRGCALLLCLAVSSCGGGGDSSSNASSSSSSTPPPSTPGNVATVTVSSGPAGVGAVNTLFTSVTVCVPNTTTCQTIDNIQVDTGSYGLRLLAQALTLTLPVTAVSTAAGTGGLVECTEFVDGYSWGPVALVDVQIAGETASSVPVQLIGDSRYPTAPEACSTPAPQAENTVATFGANGILGIGPFAQDCGDTCAEETTAQYWQCTTADSCGEVAAPLAEQVQNPITMFSADNNGSIITLPSVAAAGAATVTGTLIFGIDTESNNASGTVTVVPISDMGYLTTTFNGQSLSESFVDSGSNATYFDDENTSGTSLITECPTSGSSSTDISDFYCPASPMTLTAAFVLSDDSTANASFSVANPTSVSNTVTAFPGLAGTNPQGNSFDWGLPFFYGRRVAYAIEGAATSVGTGPYIAF